MKSVFFASIVAILAAAACTPPVAQAVQGPPERARRSECHAACAAIDMELTAMVLMMNSAGCVCQVPATVGPPGSTAGAAATSGGATIMAAQIAAQQAQQRQRQQQSYKPAAAPR